MEGLILQIQRFSTEDGPGIRTTVFFKGCPLRCAWCHNPESISPHKQVQWISTNCIGCHTCLKVCQQNALQAGKESILIDWNKCQGCGSCVEECPSGALEMLGTSINLQDLADELEKDRVFFEQSGGGVTLSGGEPLMQPEFTLGLMENLRARGIPTALDTCGVCTPERFMDALELADMLLLDIKILDAQTHQRLVGADNRLIMQNFLSALEFLRVHLHKRLWVRTPLIPGATDTPENLGAIGSFLCQHAQNVLERWELCAFNNLCRDKYLRLGMHWDFQEEPLMTQAHLEECAGWARATGINPALVVPTGATRLKAIKED